MPTKKNQNSALAETLGAAPAAPENATNAKPKSVKNPSKTGVSGVSGKSSEKVENDNPDQEKTTPAALAPGQAQVVASLVAAGYSYDDAVAMLNGTGGAPAAPAKGKKEIDAATRKLIDGDDSDLPPVEDVEERFDVVEVDMAPREGFKTLIDDLWTRREEMEDVPKKTLYRVTFDIPAPEFDWLLHRTIQEGQSRKDVGFTVQRALILLLKQQKALDPTRGGRRAGGSSGPKNSFDPKTGGWTG